jgi:hypothetical protein
LIGGPAYIGTVVMPQIAAIVAFNTLQIRAIADKIFASNR